MTRFLGQSATPSDLRTRFSPRHNDPKDIMINIDERAIARLTPALIEFAETSAKRDELERAFCTPGGIGVTIIDNDGTPIAHVTALLDDGPEFVLGVDARAIGLHLIDGELLYVE